jgi:uncharacterized protein
MIKRKIEDAIISRLNTGKAIILLGPRQTGKTTLLKKIAEGEGEYLFLNCDDPFTREQLENRNTEQIASLLGTYKRAFIDEAQRVRNIGLTLKIITDTFKNVQLLVSGSSSLELANEISEPLTGRKWEYFLYPVSWAELSDHFGHLRSMQQLETRLIYGMYPEVINNPGNEKEILQQLSGSYLYKDLLSYQGIRKPDLLEKLLKALALQIGNEVSYNELAILLQVDKKTVITYIDLLEKAFVIFRLNPLSRNIRSEISTSRKIYFYDTGIRNSLLVNFNPLAMRNDTGAIWENFLMAERRKSNHYNGNWANTWFWRTVSQQEIDYIEEKGGKFNAFEFKYGNFKKYRPPVRFTDAYKVDSVSIVSPDNFVEFVK